MFKLSLLPKVKRILRYLLQANDEIRPLYETLRKTQTTLCKSRPWRVYGLLIIFSASGFPVIREIKFGVTWSYVKRQTAKMTSEFVFFSSKPSLNRIKIEKCLLLFAPNTNIFILLFKELKTDGKSFIFVVCRLTYDHVTSNLISL